MPALEVDCLRERVAQLEEALRYAQGALESVKKASREAELAAEKVLAALNGAWK
ncbi:MAG: hypothetical protein HRJ53_20860 [Acidobacteria bacterium Pan2503]|uniref:Uncharacterized protein n=1 Tax=Candidatus Acidiferrum panamense TaxID=2741543 RepID=A0A7V8NU20_9BACT|nr:hypothetical protein [Candidatus Acidoferrum panamensis]